MLGHDDRKKLYCIARQIETMANLLDEDEQSEEIDALFNVVSQLDEVVGNDFVY